MLYSVAELHLSRRFVSSSRGYEQLRVTKTLSSSKRTIKYWPKSSTNLLLYRKVMKELDFIKYRSCSSFSIKMLPRLAVTMGEFKVLVAACITSATRFRLSSASVLCSARQLNHVKV